MTADTARSADGDIRVAGTAVVLRDSAQGVESLMLRRPSRGSFADAWVFPGGRVDPADHIGAVTEQDAAQHAAIRETAEEADIRIHALRLLSRWVPPPEAPVRYRTWFFLAREQGEDVHPNPGEIEEAVWLTPRQGLERHAAGGFTLIAPTWMTLYRLCDAESVDGVFEALGEPVFHETHMRQDDHGLYALWAGDEQHPDAPGPAGSRHRLSMGPLPWSLERR